MQGRGRAGVLEESERPDEGVKRGSRQTHSRAQSHEGAHHGRDDPGDTDWVPTASIGHAPPVQNVQAGIQHPMIKLEGGRAEVTAARGGQA